MKQGRLEILRNVVLYGKYIQRLLKTGGAFA